MSKELSVERLNLELLDLKDSLFELNEFINSKGFFELHNDMQYLLQDQRYAMTSYKEALEKRIAFINGWLKPTVFANTALPTSPASLG